MQEYLIKKNDTLWKLAKKHGTTVEAIAALNKLKGRQLHMLQVDQKIYLPGEAPANADSTLRLQFRGMDFKTVTPKKVKVEHDGREETHILDGSGALLLQIHDHAMGLKVWVEDLGKKMESVLEREILPLGKWNVNIDSRKVKADGDLQPKKGAPASTAPDVKKVTTHNAQTTSGQTAVQQARVESGKPVQALATIYTSENLRLSQGNERYRPYLINAAKKHGMTPQSLAALVDAEAAKVKGVWQEKSNQSHPDRAQGLAQFFKAAWLDVFAETTSLIHSDCAKMSERELLKKRLEAKYAIDGAATYGKLNLEAFAKKTGYAVSSLPPEDKAKLAYFLHHEGLRGAKRLLGFADPYTSAEAKKRLLGQLGKDEEKAAAVIAQYDRDPLLAYKGWLYKYVDTKINVNHFLVNSEKLGVEPRAFEDILADLSKQPAPPKPAQKPPAQKQQPKQVAKPAEKPAQVPPQKPTQAPPPAQPAPTSPAQDGDADGVWFDPLKVCTLRTASLASKKGATFGMVRNGGTRAHQGIDLCADPKTTIYAVASGRVIPAKYNPNAAYGKSLVLVVGIDDLPPAQAAQARKLTKGKEIGFFYAHLNKMPEKAMVVNAGDPLGESGCTGNASSMTTIAKGAHLHFEVRINPYVTARGLVNRADPMLFIRNCTNP